VALKQSLDVRWLSLVCLLESISRSFDVLKKIPQLKQKHFTIDIDIVNGIIRLLLPFKDILTRIQTNNAPSLHNVIISIFTLRKALESFENLVAYGKEYGSTSASPGDNERILCDASEDDETEHEGKPQLPFKISIFTTLQGCFSSEFDC
jgi:hypothetical protein